MFATDDLEINAEIVRLRNVAGMSFGDIAAKLNMTHGGVVGRYRRNGGPESRPPGRVRQASGAAMTATAGDRAAQWDRAGTGTLVVTTIERPPEGIGDLSQLAASGEVDTQAGGGVKVSGGRPGVTIAIGDMQLGEKEFLLRPWLEVLATYRDRIAALQPEWIKLVLVGDMVTGAGVFRGQDEVVAVANVDPQVAYAASHIQDFVDTLAPIAPTTVLAIRGNHDRGKGSTDHAAALVLMLNLLGTKAKYAGARLLVDLAPTGAKQFLLHVEHSWGNSTYSPNSMSFIRAIKDYLIQCGVWGRVESGVIRRIVVGHTHWLNIGHDLAGVRLDTVGGWTKPNRHGLGGAVRAIGGILYVHDGADVATYAIRPTDAVLMEEVDNPYLDTDIMQDAATRMRWIREQMIDIGMMPAGGVH